MQLIELEKELSGPGSDDALKKYDGILLNLDERISKALQEGLSPDKYADAEQLKNAVTQARKLLRLAVRND